MTVDREEREDAALTAHERFREELRTRLRERGGLSDELVDHAAVSAFRNVADSDSARAAFWDGYEGRLPTRGEEEA